MGGLGGRGGAGISADSWLLLGEGGNGDSGADSLLSPPEAGSWAASAGKAGTGEIFLLGLCSVSSWFMTPPDCEALGGLRSPLYERG